MGSLFSINEDNKKEQALKELRDWEKEMYANNSYLHYIPTEIKERKMREIKQRLNIQEEV